MSDENSNGNGVAFEVLRRDNERYRGEAARKKEKIRDLEGKLKAATDELGPLREKVSTAEKERDEWKTKAESSPNEWKTKAEDLQTQLQSRDHRDAWRTAVGDQLQDKVAIEKVWAEIGYKPGDKIPTAEEITTQVAAAREAAPYLFRPAGATSAASSQPGTTSAITVQASTPGPGVARGSQPATSNQPKTAAQLVEHRWAKYGSRHDDGRL